MSNYPPEIWLVSAGDDEHASNWVATSGPHGERYVLAKYLPVYAMMQIQSVVDKAIESADKKDFDGEAINWGDLCCVDVGVNMSGGYTVVIEEATPDCPNFHAYIYDSLSAAGYHNVEVFTEW